ncbi:hypothetical protein [Mycobacterium asiaticum]|uniref:Uncharacterized protein n=1 Tax=Mycobacterium asiaticum TaxID=1790 RepID=A0A1A3N6B9_MYCAS|nr:hypothetical protein [Mycobacterium asiaticum]OBK15917.1 hypothetical protein A5636_00335 [Mycobacterium asiaticum]
MTVLIVGCALGMALCIGYQWGRRTDPQPVTQNGRKVWKIRTSRVAIGRLAVQLAALVISRRIHRMLLVRAPLPAALGGWAALRSRLR